MITIKMSQYDIFLFFLLFLFFVSYLIFNFSYSKHSSFSTPKKILQVSIVSCTDSIAHDLLFSCVHPSIRTLYKCIMLKPINSNIIVYSPFAMSYDYHTIIPNIRMFNFVFYILYSIMLYEVPCLVFSKYVEDCLRCFSIFSHCSLYSYDAKVHSYLSLTCSIPDLAVELWEFQH